VKFKLAFLICFLTNVIFSQEICPVENVSVFGGDSQNIVSWDEPANPFVSTFTLELTTDTYGYETSWDLVDQFGTIIAEEPSDGDFSSNEVYTWEFDIEPGTYVFTIYDSYGDGLYDGAGFTIWIDGVMVHEFLGSTTDQEDNFEEYQVSINTDQGWFGITSQTYTENVPFEKGQYLTEEMVENLTSSEVKKVSTGSFNLQRPVPEGCGDFVTYRVYQQNGTVIGNTTDLEFAHTGISNGTEYCYYVSAVYDVDGVETVSEASNIACGTPEEWVAAAPSNLMSFPADEEVLLIWQGPGGGGGGDGTEGDNIDNPFIVTALPFYAEGTTAGYEDDYDEVCPYSNSASADVVYMMTSSGATYDFSLCTNTAYDSKIYILDADGNVVITDATTYGIACNDDACSTPSFTSPYVSELPGINLDAGLYYVVVDGYGSNDGTYTLDISLSAQQTYEEPVTSNNQSRNEYDFLGYNVYVGDALQNSEPIESTSYTVTGLQNGVQYTFGVVAVYDGPVGGDNYESDMITVQDASSFIYGDISGTITDPNGAPLDSAIVSAGGLKDTTGADGAYMLMNLIVGSQTVTVVRNNFASQVATVTVLAQAEPTVQDFVLSPDMPAPVALSATPGDEKVYLSWRTPGSVAEYDLAYYDEAFEGQIGCGYGGCFFGVRFTPANYPATLQNVVVSIQGTEYGGGTSNSASILVFLDPDGLIAGPPGDPTYIASGLDFSTEDATLTQFSVDLADAGIEISSGDVYIVVSDGGGFLSIANDQEPATPEYYDRNWVSTGYGFETIFDSYANLAGDFGILAGFIGAPGAPESVSYAVQSEPVEADNNLELISGRISNTNPDQSFTVESSDLGDVLPEIYVPRPIPDFSNNLREEDPEAYNVYLVADDLITTLVSTTADTLDTVSVESNYSNYCYVVKAQYDTGEPLDGGYGIVESRASNTACAVPFAVGDANFDSETTIEDVLTLVDFILEETTPSSAAFNNSDVNMDDELNIADVVMVVDIISGSSTARVANYGSFASLELVPNYNTSDLTVNLSYDGGLKGLEFDIEYDSDILSLSAPSLVVMQDNVVSTFNHIDEGLIKVIVFDIAGDFIIPNENNDLLKMSFNFFGDLLDESSVNINNVIVSGPKGSIANVSSNVVSAAIKLVPGVFALHQNYPNPFNPNTEIRFDIPEVTKVDISIFNLMGQKVKTLKNEKITPGYHTVQWDGTNDNGIQVSTGMYFYTLQTEAKSAMRKMLFLK
jgi:hypothetical protein